MLIHPCFQNNSSNESQLEFEISNENASNSNLKMLLPAFGESNKLLNRAGSAFPAEKYDLKFMCHICNTHFNNKNNFVEHNKQNHKGEGVNISILYLNSMV